MTIPVAARVRGLSHRYGATVALDDVTLDIPANCMVGLIGPDGVGKSTLLALISGVRRIQEGEVFALDGDMNDPEHRRASLPRIAYMPQGLGRNLYPTLSVFENLDFFGRLFGQPKSEREWRIRELLAATGLDPFPDRPAGKLSGGMKQKLSLCCSLIHDPDLLILDEPTTGVDPLSRRQFWKLIDRIRARRPGMSVRRRSWRSFVTPKSSRTPPGPARQQPGTALLSRSHRPSRRSRRDRSYEPSTGAASGPMRGGRRWKSCAIRSGSPSRSSAPSW